MALLIAKIINTVLTFGYIPILFKVSAVHSHIHLPLTLLGFYLNFYPKWHSPLML
jgi:hypothetical protein